MRLASKKLRWTSKKMQRFIDSCKSIVESAMLAHVSRTESTATAPALEPAPNHPWWRMRSSTRCSPEASPTRTATESGPGRRPSRLPYLRELGVDALCSARGIPRRSPIAGYDISDYRSIDPALGTLEAGRAADRRGPGAWHPHDRRIVPNHVSNEHPWFAAAFRRGAGSPERARFWFRAGTAERPSGRQGWQSIFGGSAGRAPARRAMVPPSFCPGAAGPELGAPGRMG